MNDGMNRSVPVAYDIRERSLTRVCPDKKGLGGFRELVKKSFRTTDLPIEDHIHPDAVELCYAYRGAQYYSVGGREYELSAGDVFLTYPDEIHSSGGRTQEMGGLLYYMIIDTRNDLDRFMGLGPNDGPTLAASLTALPRCFHAGYALKAHFDAMFEAYCAQTALSPLLLRSHFCLLIGSLTAAAAQMKRHDQPDILLALDIIEERLPNIPTIRDLAEMLHLSESYFKQKFRQEMGLPPAKYIMQRRIALAQRLLAEGRNVTETAYELGFSSSQHFATYFKAYTRQTPSEWRQACGEREEDV